MITQKVSSPQCLKCLPRYCPQLQRPGHRTPGWIALFPSVAAQKLGLPVYAGRTAYDDRYVKAEVDAPSHPPGPDDGACLDQKDDSSYSLLQSIQYLWNVAALPEKVNPARCDQRIRGAINQWICWRIRHSSPPGYGASPGVAPSRPADPRKGVGSVLCHRTIAQAVATMRRTEMGVCRTSPGLATRRWPGTLSIEGERCASKTSSRE